MDCSDLLQPTLMKNTLFYCKIMPDIKMVFIDNL